MSIDIQKIRTDFPILQLEVNGKPLIYFDNAATSQKPKQVLDVVNRYYENSNANIHRGVHYLSQKATDQYEEARRIMKRFINAESEVEVNFTKGTTEGINLLASIATNSFVNAGDEIIISELEHHSNIVPWQMLCQRTGATLKFVPVDDDGIIQIDQLETMITDKTKLIAISYISNALGTVHPVKKIIELAHQRNALVLLDAAQAAPHTKIDVQALDCDFLCFSGHKMCAPTGTGIFYGKAALLNELPPYMGGGEMIKEVSIEGTTYNELPFKYEAGTPNISGGIGIAAAANYLMEIGMDDIAEREVHLMRYAENALSQIEGMRIYGKSENKTSVVSFNLEGIHAYDLGVLLDQMGIACRTGHHCCQPLMKRLGIDGTCRASFAFYNTEAEIDELVKGIKRAQKMLS
ncbi:UNVERIFIED_CONTAM: hypothetical protein GTU68_045352 [Idotea baltica]|nr:hypothetical protein [Idotea baltica]